MEQIDVLAIASVVNRPENSAIAACRAGAVGCLCLDQEGGIGSVLDRLKFVRKHDAAPIGLIISSVAPERLSPLLEESIPNLKFYLAAEEAPSLATWAEFFSKRGIPFSVQVTSCDDGLRAAELGASSIILKGSESGGLVGTETAFILAQRWHKTSREHQISIPFLVQGGVGLNTAAAVMASGASGFVLDSQLLLARESQLDEGIRKWIQSADGSEVSSLGGPFDHPCNFFHRPNSPAFKELAEVEKSLSDSALDPATKAVDWKNSVKNILSSGSARECLPFGQDICLANSLAENFVTVGGIISEIRNEARESLALASRLRHLAADSPLARSHGTRYPVLQGPMTRVSDTADFACSVAENGGLSFLALAVMRKPEVEKLLDESAARLSGKSWGVGILGFLPPSIRAEQSEVILKHKPPFAIIAGGRPDQAKQFEDEGIATYLHVPSPGLLQTFLRQGARRFIFEGRECGGHVGPRSSFVLWQSACDILTEQLREKPIKDLHIVFAGGIHDEVSSCMIAAMTAPLAEKGVKIGLLMGTAYLFTKEAVDSGAIVPRFQKEALGCDKTVLLQTGPGHAIRCIKTPYCDDFEEEKNRLIEKGATHEDLIRNLEGMNIGRLRVASKGVDRKKENGSATRTLVQVNDEEQFDRGMYMIGQVAALETEVITMADLHDKVCNGGADRLAAFAEAGVKVIREQKPSEIAIVGMSCFYPDASSLDEYWQNILDRHCAVREIPQSQWDWRLYYDADPKAKDRIVSKWGCFLKDIKFDPLQYGITPKSMESIEPLQLLTLEAVNSALIDAGYKKRPFNRDRTACIVGVGGGGGPKAVAYGFRTCMRLTDYFKGMPILSDDIIEQASEVLPDWTEDSFPGMLNNICSGRVANRFNLGGPNYSIDAACASSLASIDACVRELESGNVDMGIAMGADVLVTPLTYMAFSKTHALSPKGQIKPFDAAGDGIVLAEGIGVVILKRLEDAKRDGDKIYALIQGIGSSSDGKAKGLTAPNAIGQARALHRAYAKANISPSRVELIEAHGTGTVVGDQTEATSLSTVLRESGADIQSCALGSVKSMIGHTKCAAGIAGVIKTALALHHKILPPTLVDVPNPTANFEESSLYLNKEVRPWVHEGETPRTAGVSAFGFGGTNYHAVLSEYKDGFEDQSEAASKHWPTELFVWRGSKEELPGEISTFADQLDASTGEFHLGELSAAVNRKALSLKGEATLSIIAKDRKDLREKLTAAISNLKSKDSFEDPRGIVFQSSPGKSRKIGFLFPGQGSQYPNMLADLAVNFPQVRKSLDLASSIVGDRISRPLGRYIYPPSAFTEAREAESARQLASTEIAQPSLGACSAAVTQLLRAFGVTPDAVAGHSYGEYVALYVSGILTEEQLYEISYLRGFAIRENLQGGSAMLAINADAKTVKDAISDLKDVYIANINSPKQTVLSVTESMVPGVEEIFSKSGIQTKRIPVACGFHAPFVEKAAVQLRSELDHLKFGNPSLDIYSNSLAGKYPEKIDQQKDLLRDHLTTTVDFAGMIESMRRDGVDLFIEVGPGSILSGLCKEITGGQDCEVLTSDQKGRHGMTQLQSLLGKLFVMGIDIDLDLLSRIRKFKAASIKEILTPVAEKEKPNTWIINGARCRLINQPEPLLLGQPHPELVKANKVEAIIHSRESHQKTEPKAPQPVVVNQNQPNVPGPVPKPQPTSTGSMHQNLPATNYSNGTKNPVAADQVMLGFQNVMSQFLETQRAVMVSYLGGNPGNGGNGSHYSPPPAKIPAVAMPQVPMNGGPKVSPDFVRQKETEVNRVESVMESKPSPVSSNGHGKPEAKTRAELEVKTVSLDEIRKHLLEIVGERTGYPEDMLDVDLDLEADLGIDSIKRVEILGELAEFIMPDATSMMEESGMDLEKLSGLRSLQQILDYMEEFLAGQAVADPETKKKSPSLDSEDNGIEETPIQRGLVKLKDCPLPRGASLFIPSGVILITDDGEGHAEACADRFSDFGQDVVVVKHIESDNYVPGTYTANLKSSDSVEALIKDIQSNLGAIGGIIHLLPFAPIAAGLPFATRAELEAKSIYLITKAAETEICRIAEKGNAFVISATALGGQLGFGDHQLDSPARAGSGSISGYLKCLGLEWPDVVVRSIDFDASATPEEVVSCIEQELSDPEGPTEVGYWKGERVTWEAVSAEIAKTSPVQVDLNSKSVILMTGGARGITAAIAEELGKRFQPRLILVGRSPLPPENEDASTRDFTQQADLKNAIMKGLSSTGTKPTPALVEAQYREIMTAREVRRNIDAIKATGATVEYHPADVRDRAQLAGICEDLYRRFGTIDGVIHGAGVIDDKLVKDKTPESFDRVFSTKVESSFTLAEILKPESLKFLSFFASIASRYGNRGQSDYAAANEVLCKLATDLDRRWAARVFAVAWGPWKEIGMVSDLEKHLAARGVALIRPEVGCRMFVDEIILGRKGESEVIIAGGTENLRSAATQPSRQTASNR